MNCPFKPLTLALACLGTAGAFNALAAQPANLPATTPVTKATVAAPQVVLTAPGVLKVFKAPVTEVLAGQSLAFKLEGSGYCKVKLNGGDSYIRDFEGELPFTASYPYSTASMNSYETSKDYTASIAATGNCKLDKALPSIKVTVTNPNPQGVSPPNAMNPVMSNSKLTMSGFKPATPPAAPVVPVASALTSLGVAFAPQAGAPTMLTINGSGACKYRVSHVMQEAPMAAQPMLSYSNASPNPFSMTLKMLDATPAGHYVWTATGIEGCSGSLDLAVTVP